MAGLIKRLWRNLKSRDESESEQGQMPTHQIDNEPLLRQELDSLDFSESLETNLGYIKEVLANCSDVFYREFDFAQNERIKMVFIYVEGLVKEERINEFMHSLMLEAPLVEHGKEFSTSPILDLIKKKLLPVRNLMETNNLGQTIDSLLSGDTILLINGCSTAIVITATRGWPGRNVEESKTEMVVRGPREAFVETLQVNTSLIRRKIKNPNLKIENIKLGQITNTDVALVYIKGIVNKELVIEARRRLERIKIDAVLESGYIEELIEDDPYSPFCTIYHTERPDKVAAQILEGRIAILVDGTPYALTAPLLFAEALQAPEDYYQRTLITSALRLLRVLSVVLSLLLSPFYISIITFHHEMLPTPLLLSFAAQREAVPFPAFIEVFVMEIFFEILREAGIRLPMQVGQAVSIVGALVIGDAAVRAGLIGAGTVIVVALTGIASFTFCYAASISIRLLRFPLMILAGTMGLYGVICGVMFILFHLAGLRSFGVPFLYPLGPLNIRDQKDVFIRAPLWAMLRRPRPLGMEDPQRAAAGLKPAPPRDRKKK